MIDTSAAHRMGCARLLPIRLPERLPRLFSLLGESTEAGAMDVDITPEVIAGLFRKATRFADALDSNAVSASAEWNEAAKQALQELRIIQHRGFHVPEEVEPFVTGIRDQLDQWNRGRLTSGDTLRQFALDGLARLGVALELESEEPVSFKDIDELIQHCDFNLKLLENEAADTVNSIRANLVRENLETVRLATEAFERIVLANDGSTPSVGEMRNELRRA